jgi:hypothetical protein
MDQEYSSIRHTNIRGVSGAYRQRLIEEWVSAGDLLTLKREWENEHDPNAIAVMVNTGEIDEKKIGYISRDLAEDLAPIMDGGQEIDCFVLAVTGGEIDKPTRGVNVELHILTREETLEREKRIREKFPELAKYFPHQPAQPSPDPVQPDQSSPAPVQSAQPSPTPVQPARKKIGKVRRTTVLLGVVMLFMGLIGIGGIAEQTTATDKLMYAGVVGIFILVGIALIFSVGSKGDTQIK